MIYCLNLHIREKGRNESVGEKIHAGLQIVLAGLRGYVFEAEYGCLM